MRVFRIEHPIHGGAFHGCYDAGLRSRCDIEDECNSRGIYPSSPWEMPGPGRCYNQDRVHEKSPCSWWEGKSFAYPDMTELLHWWPEPWRRRFHQLGFVINVYETHTDYVRFQTQVAFDKATADHTHTIPLYQESTDAQAFAA